MLAGFCLLVILMAARARLRQGLAPEPQVRDVLAALELMKGSQPAQVRVANIRGNFSFC